MKQITHIKLLELLEKHPIEFKLNMGAYVNELFDTQKLLNTEWLNENKNWSWHAEPNQKNTTTYADCRYANVTAKNNEILLDLIIWDGDAYNGTRTNTRCSFLFSIDKKSPIIKLIKSKLLDELHYVAKIEYESIQLKQKQDAINDILANMLA